MARFPKHERYQLFLQNAYVKHSDKFDYSKTIYVKNNTEVIITCPIHGDIEIRPSTHLVLKHGCKQCGELYGSKNAPYTNEGYIKAIQASWGDRYDYSKINYINQKTPIIIMCRTHGEFLQHPGNHLANGIGCPTCGLISKAAKLVKSQDQFIQELINQHGDTYDYSKVNYINGSSDIIITCKKHGDFTQAAFAHLHGQGCRECGLDNIRLTQDDFLERAHNVFGDRYDYSKTIYVHYTTPIIVTCKIHGDFNIRPCDHLVTKYGCKECSKEKNIGCYNKDYFNINTARKDVRARFYCVQLYDKQYDQCFIKVGISTNSIKSRFGAVFTKKRFEQEVLIDYEDSLYSVFLLERLILKQFKQYQLYPFFEFDGRTECINPEVKLDLVDYITNIIEGI